MDTIIELSIFNNIKFYEKEHIYYIDGVKLTSATQLIGKYKEKFDADYWAERKSIELDKPKEEILKEWDYKREFACEKGILLHNYAENYINNKLYPYSSTNVIAKFGKDELEPIFTKLKKLFDKFYDDSYSKLIPIKSELVVGDEELGIGGMVDQLFWNTKSDELQIWDWKTNKKIKNSNKWQKFKKPIDHLEVCELNTYSLQLSLYKFIIEKNTSLKLGDCYIVWLNEKNEKYEIFKCHDFTKEIKLIIEDFNND